MTVCAVRTLEVSLAKHHNNLWANAEKLPHEPKSEHRFALKPVTDGNKIASLHWSDGNYAECKHCGCIYPEES